MSKPKLIAIGIFILIAIGAGFAQYWWKTREVRREVSEVTVEDRQEVIKDLGPLLITGYQEFLRTERRPPVNLAEMATHANAGGAVAAAKEAMGPIFAGAELGDVVRYVQPVDQPMPTQPILVFNPDHHPTAGTRVTYANGHHREIAPARAAAVWQRAKEMIDLATREGRGVTAAEWGEDFLE